MEKKVFALAMVMGFGVSAFAQEVKNDSTVCDSTALAFYEPTDSTVTDSTALAFYEPTDSTVTDSTALAFYEPTDSTVTDSTALAFYEPTDTTVCDSTSLAFYEPTDTTVCDSTDTCPSKAELALAANRKYNGAEYDKAVAVEEDNVFAAIFKRENEMA